MDEFGEDPVTTAKRGGDSEESTSGGENLSMGVGSSQVGEVLEVMPTSAIASSSGSGSRAGGKHDSRKNLTSEGLV